MSRQNYQGYGATREYRDDPNYGEYRDQDVGFSDLGFSTFDEACDQITINISTINNGASNIEKAARIVGSDRDQGQIGEKIHQISQDMNKIVSSTTKLIKQLFSRRLERAHKLKLEKVKNDFQESLQRFQTLQKKAAEKVKTVSRLQKQRPKQDAAGWLDHDDDTTGLVENEKRHQQLMAQDQIITDDLALIHEREEQIRELEADVLDVNEIFRDLGAMVQDQGEQIDSIEGNVEKAYTDVENGTEQLGQAATYQKKSRKKLCCLVVILVIVAAVVAIIIVVSVKK